MTFALCGFANFSSIAIQMAVTGNLAPNLPVKRVRPGHKLEAEAVIDHGETTGRKRESAAECSDHRLTLAKVLG